MTREQAYLALEKALQLKLEQAKEVFNEAQESVVSEAKSTAGDKHETGRAMAQLEVEKAGKKVFEAEQAIKILPLLKKASVQNTIALGSLIQTSFGWFYLSTGIGKIQMDETTIYCIGYSSPIAQSLIGKKKKDSFELNENQYEIIKLL